MFFGVDGGGCCRSFMYGCGGSDGGDDGVFFNQDVGIGLLFEMVHRGGGAQGCSIIAVLMNIATSQGFGDSWVWRANKRIKRLEPNI